LGGPVYNQVIRKEDLVADIHPRPEYIVEPYLVVSLRLQAGARSVRASRLVLVGSMRWL
jgi:hypothetical protein